ncbi:hypothetical protein [Lacrimispora indolis]|uniref:hypothetical protein n=1 Tax=Lacrimispora indolis TaxID=69825 RepID=UPI000462771C|nr:hypothetical protein [[Clostridium] methoxybenzovorans]
MKIKLSEANKKASAIIKRLAQNEINKGSDSQYKDSMDIFFLIRDGLCSKPLDLWELENYDNCYGVDLSR